MKRIILIITITLLNIVYMFAQNVGINSTGAAPDASAGLDIDYTDKGILIPRVDITDVTTAAPITSPVTSLIVYNTNTTTGPGYFFWNGSRWINFFTGNQSPDWKLQGNAGTTVGTNFLGTTDNISLSFKTNNSERMRILNTGNIGIGTTTPQKKLEIGSGYAIRTQYLDPGNRSSSYEFVRFGASSEYWAGLMHNINSGSYGNGNDFTIFTYGNRDIVLYPGSGQTHILGGNVGIGITNPTHKLTVYTTGSETMRIYSNGTAGAGSRFNFGDGDYVYIDEPTDDAMHIHASRGVSVTSYLKVGNPSTPSNTASGDRRTLYSWNGQEQWSDWSNDDICGSSSANWVSVSNNSDNLIFLRYDNPASRSRKGLISPWVWAPTGSSIWVDIRAYASTEENYDGVFLEYTTNGTSYTKVTSFSIGAYDSGNISGSNTSCNGSNSQPAWDAGGDNYFSSRTNNLALGGNWVRFRFVGMSDGSGSSGEFNLYSFTISAFLPSFGGSFASGNIYAEKNIYAGSNVLLGDMAEYFPIEGISEPGDLISMNPKYTDIYKVTDNAYDNFVIGVHSTNPTVTINAPSSGIPVALRGRVPVKVSLENGDIKIGDFLTASSKKGYAMKAIGSCYVVGRALGNYTSENEDDKVLCLIENTWYKPNKLTESNRSFGSVSIPFGKKELYIKDNNIGEESMIFITMKNNPGTAYWISDIKESSFKINFAEDVKQDIKFNYLIENAKEEIKTNQIVNKNKVKNINNNKEVLLDDAKSSNLTITEIQFDNYPDPPPVPKDPTKMYKWSSKQGVVLMKENKEISKDNVKDTKKQQ